MSTSVLYPNAATAWKQEVHQRLAAHRQRRSLLTAQPAEPAHWAVSRGRGSLVAARVAARYAHAPSYSELQSVEAPLAAPAVGARAVVAAPQPLLAPPDAESWRTWETWETWEAPRASIAEAEALPAVSLPWKKEAQLAVVSGALPELAAAPESAPQLPPESLDAWESECAQNVWHPDPRLSPVASDVVRSPRPTLMDQFYGGQGPVAVEPDLPIPANLIEFPRELVAQRKMRPRRAERFAAEGMERQLSIFEVDPGAYEAPSEPAAAPPALPQTEWSGIKLQAQAPLAVKREEHSAPEVDVHLAPMGHRLMAVLVDGALVTAVFVAFAMLAAAGAGALPASKVVAFSAAAILLLLGFVYQSLFLLLAGATPGMKYAGISLCTFDGRIPLPVELRSRLGALLLSVAPMGVGVAWALFDEDHLCWHDRLSGTYLRKE